LGDEDIVFAVGGRATNMDTGWNLALIDVEEG
jgi:hypothetical protein